MRGSLGNRVYFFFLMWVAVVLSGCICKSNDGKTFEMQEFDSFLQLMSILLQQLRAG